MKRFRQKNIFFSHTILLSINFFYVKKRLFTTLSDAYLMGKEVNIIGILNLTL